MNDIKNFVKKIVRKYGTNDPYVLCNLLGVLVRQVDLINVQGIYQYDLRKRIIHINCTLEAHEQRQVLAQVLAHALFHKKINTIFLDTNIYLLTEKIESEADIFATELLIIGDDPVNNY